MIKWFKKDIKWPKYCGEKVGRFRYHRHISGDTFSHTYYDNTQLTIRQTVYQQFHVEIEEGKTKLKVGFLENRLDKLPDWLQEEIKKLFEDYTTQSVANQLNAALVAADVEERFKEYLKQDFR